MQKHVLIALAAGRCFHVAGAAALDLDAAPGFLLDVFDVGSAVSDDLGTEVEARHRLEANRDLLLGPFALFIVRLCSRESKPDGALTRPNSSRSTGGPCS